MSQTAPGFRKTQRKNPNFDWLKPLVAGLAFLVSGLLFFTFSADVIMQTYTAKHDWIVVPCHVEQVELKCLRLRSIGSKKKTSIIYEYEIRTEYRYEAGGHMRRGTRFAFWESTGLKDYAERLANDLKNTPDRVCYVNPADFNESVLNVDMNWRWSAAQGIPLIFAAVGLGFSAYGINLFLKRKRKNPPFYGTGRRTARKPR